MPARNVVPKPLQKPHPPLWVAASRRETTMVAARLGMGSLGFGFETPDELGERALEYYRLVREELMPIGHAINPALAVLNTFMMARHRRGGDAPQRQRPGLLLLLAGLLLQPGSRRRAQAGRPPTSTATSWPAPARPPRPQAQRGGFLSAAEIATRRARRTRSRRRSTAPPAPATPSARPRRCAGRSDEVRGPAPRRDDLRRPVRRPQARAHHGIDRDLRQRAAAGVQGAARDACTGPGAPTS